MKAKEDHEGQIEDRADSGQAGTFLWMMVLGLAFLTSNYSGTAIHRSDDSLAALGFVVFSYMDLVLLFLCLRRFEKALPGSPTRERLKVTIWVLTALLICVYSYKIAAIMTQTVRTLVWAIAAITELGGFYAFFLHREETNGAYHCPAPHSWFF